MQTKFHKYIEYISIRVGILKKRRLKKDYERNTDLVDLPWFHVIFNAFSLSLLCVQKPFCIDFFLNFSLFVRNLSKDVRESF